MTPALNYSTMYAGNLSVGLSAQVLSEVHEAAQKTSTAALEVLSQRYCAGVKVVIEARPGVALSVII